MSKFEYFSFGPPNIAIVLGSRDAHQHPVTIKSPHSVSSDESTWPTSGLARNLGLVHLSKYTQEWEIMGEMNTPDTKCR